MRPPILFCFALLLAACSRQKVDAPVPKPSPPESQILSAPVAKSVPTPWPDVLATLEGSSETPVTNRIAGFLLKQNYRAGTPVKSGQSLFVLDPLISHVSTEGITHASDTVSIDAPVDGVPTQARHGAGDWLAAGTELATIQTCDPMRAEFLVPTKVDPNAAHAMRFKLILSDGTVYGEEGSIVSVVAGKTGEFAVTAKFPNAHGQLMPGEYVKIRATPVPAGAINSPTAVWR